MTGCSPGRRARLLCSLLFLIVAAVPLAAQTWVKLAAPSPTPDLYGVHFFTRDSGYVCGEISGAGKLYLTINGGTSWTLVALPGTPGPLNDLYFRPGTNFGIVTGNGGYAAVTNDHGTTWTQRSVPAAVWTGDIQGVYFKDATNGFIVAKALGAAIGVRMAKTANGGATWTNVAFTGATTTTNLYDIDFGDATHGIIVGSSPSTGSGQVRKSASTDGGTTWEPNAAMGATTAYPMIFPGVDAADGTATVYAAGGKFSAGTPAPHGQVLKSTDNGATWNLTTLNGLANPIYNQPCNGVIAVNDQIAFVSAQGGKLYRTMDGGANWSQEILPGAVGTSELKRLSETPTEELYVVGRAGNVLRATLIGHGLFANTDLQFRKSCPGDQVTLTTSITNIGTAKLKIDSIPVIQPSAAGVTYTVVSFPKTIPLGGTGTVTVRADVSPQAGPGLFSGMMRVFTNDSNYAGRDTVRALPLALPVTTKSFSIDSSSAHDAGSIRVGFSAYLPLSNFLTVTGECPIRITSLRLAVGTDFSTGSFSPVTLSSAQKFGLSVSFEPKKGCARYDTLIVGHDGINPAPIRIPISGTGLEQSFTTSVDTLFLGNVLVGTPAAKPLDLLNRKPGSCLDTTSIYTFRLDGPNKNEFSTPFSVPAGKSVMILPDSLITISISGTPAAPGQRIAYAISTNNIPNSAPDTVVLVINGVQPNLANAAQNITFPLTDVGGRRDSTVNDFLVNLGSAPAKIDTVLIVGGNAADFSYRTPVSPFTVPIAGKQSIAVSFLPSGIGDRNATLEIRSSALAQPLKIPLMGKGAIAHGGYRSGVVICPETSVNACSDTLLASFIVNSGTVPLRLKSSRITDDPANGAAGDSLAFSIVAPTFPPDLVIPPGDSAAITVRFCAKEPRPYYAELLLGNNSDSAQFHLQLIGPAKSSKVIAVDSILFTATRVATQRDTTVAGMIFNRETGPLVIDSMSISGADALSFSVISPAGAFAIPPGSDSSVAIRFHPARRSRHVAILEIYTSQGHRRVILAGPAIYPFLEVIPDPATNFNVRLGRRRALKFNIMNAGDDSARVENATIAGSPAFSNVSVGPFPARLLPGESLPITVDFTPDHLCAHPATIRLVGEGVRGVYAIADTVVAITGNGVAPMIGSRDNAISFGSRQIGSRNDSVLSDFAGNIDFLGAACVDSTAIDSLTITGSSDFSLLSPTDPLASRPMPPRTLLPFAIRFSPSGSGLRTAQLNIYFDGDPDSVRRIDLLGAGSALPIKYGPANNMIRIDFGNLRLNAARDSSFTATNISTAPLAIDALVSSNPSEMRIISPSGVPFVMQPNVPVVIQVRFSPTGTLGARSASVAFRSGDIVDSAFRLLGNGVRDALRSASDTLDFGIRSPNDSYDSVAILINDTDATVSDPSFLDSALIDRAEIVVGGEFYQVISVPRVVDANGRDSVRIRFSPGGGFGARDGALRIFYNRRADGSNDLFDTLTIALKGTVGGALMLHADLGNDTGAAPGTTIRVPIAITGDMTAAAIDSLDITLGFRKTLLEPIAITATRPGVIAELAPPDAAPTVHGTARISIRSSEILSAGMIAEITFKVLLGDSLSCVVRYDSIAVPGRPGVSFLTDSIGFSIANFCDPRGRLIQFDSTFAFASKPNPALRATTFEYTLPAVVAVRLSIYDASGAELARLADGPQNPGSYSIPFDASMLSDGTYYCVLTAGRFAKTLILRRTE